MSFVRSPILRCCLYIPVGIFFTACVSSVDGTGPIVKGTRTTVDAFASGARNGTVINHAKRHCSGVNNRPRPFSSIKQSGTSGRKFSPASRSIWPPPTSRDENGKRKVCRNMVSSSEWLVSGSFSGGGPSNAVSLLRQFRKLRGGEEQRKKRKRKRKHDGGDNSKYFKYHVVGDTDMTLVRTTSGHSYQDYFNDDLQIYLDEADGIEEEWRQKRRVRAVDSENAYNPRLKLLPTVRAVSSKLIPGGVRMLDASVVLTYLCTAIVINTPVVLLPVIAADPAVNGIMSNVAATSAGASSGSIMQLSGGGAPAAGAVMSVASFVASVASVATFGGAIGKFINGFVCQTFGGRRSSSLYLLGLSSSTFLLSIATNFRGVASAGILIEFFASIMWVACIGVLATHYESDPVSLTRGVTALSLSSTAGALTAKLGFSVLLQRFHWRTVARFASVFGILGFCVVQGFVHDSRSAKSDPRQSSLTISAVLESMKAVLGNRLFWAVALAHSMAFLARTSDKVLGAFFQDVTTFPRHLCGGLTSSVTIGFVHGLLTGRKFDTMETCVEKKKFLEKRYATTVLSALLLALCATGCVGRFLGGNIIGLMIAVTSGIMASSASFQFYQFPAAFAKGFGKNKDVCLSLLDGVGFLVSAPIWAVTGRVAGGGVAANGWSVAWLSMAVWFSVGAVLMMRAVPNFLEWKSNGSGAISGYFGKLWKSTSQLLCSGSNSEVVRRRQLSN